MIGLKIGGSNERSPRHLDRVLLKARLDDPQPLHPWPPMLVPRGDAREDILEGAKNQRNAPEPVVNTGSEGVRHRAPRTLRGYVHREERDLQGRRR